MTDEWGNRVAEHEYFPFGQEVTPLGEGDVMKFTGHERDLGNPSSPADDLDYMHARHFSALTGRFLSVDPVRGAPAQPQSWNRYSYVYGRPLSFVDPDGRAAMILIDPNTSKNVSHSSLRHSGGHKLYLATIVRYKLVTTPWSPLPIVMVVSTTQVWVGLTAEHPSVAAANANLRQTSDPRAVANGDVPAGTFEVTRSNGARGGPRGWYMYNSPGERPGHVRVGHLVRDGMSIHGGLPCSATGCITTPDWTTFDQEIGPEVDSGEPVQVVVPDLYGGSTNVP